MAVVCSHIRGSPCKVLGMGTQISGVPVKNGAGESFVMSFVLGDGMARRIGNKNMFFFSLINSKMHISAFSYPPSLSVFRTDGLSTAMQPLRGVATLGKKLLWNL